MEVRRVIVDHVLSASEQDADSHPQAAHGARAPPLMLLLSNLAEIP